MIQSTLTTKGQTTLPKEMRTALGLKPGDKLCYVPFKDGYLVRRPLRLEDLADCLDYDGPPVSLEDMDAGIAAHIREKFPPPDETGGT